MTPELPTPEAGAQLPLTQVYTTPAASNPIKTLVLVAGICFTLLGAFYLVMAIIPAAGFGVAAVHSNSDPNARHITAGDAGSMLGMFAAFSGAIIVVGILDLIAGIGLLLRKRWARMVAIVASFPMLIAFPFGTLLSIFTLYILLRRGAKENYLALCARG